MVLTALPEQSNMPRGIKVVDSLSIGDGLVGAPGLFFTQDPDTGLYRIGGNNIGLALNGAKAVDFSGSLLLMLGNIGMNLGGLTGQFTHAITAPRLWTMRDLDGSLALEYAKHLQLPPFSLWSEANVAGGDSLTTNPAWLNQQIDTTAALSTTALYTTAMGVNSNGDVYDYVDWSKKLKIEFEVARSGADANFSWWFHLKPATSVGALAEAGIGIKIVNLALYGETYGSSLETVDLSTTLTNVRPVHITILFTGSKIEWFVGGVSKGSSTTAAKLPSGIASTDCYWIASASNGGQTLGGTRSTVMSIPRYSQED